MRNPFLRIVGRRPSTSRNGRAEKYSRRFRLKLRQEIYRGILPRLGLLAVFVGAALALFPPTRTVRESSVKP
ncbi:MAG: hypothetical protein H6Q78_347, partial [Candidatus Krumholzibacteriota bacterium]|nr:hypothetical protein [Candidatus Krumholzibacteriota bacterium]